MAYSAENSHYVQERTHYDDGEDWKSQAGTAIQPSELKILTTHATKILDQLSHINATMRSTADAVFGPQPEESAKNISGAGPISSGLIGNLYSALRMIDNEVSSLRKSAERFGSL